MEQLQSVSEVCDLQSHYQVSAHFSTTFQIAPDASYVSISAASSAVYRRLANTFDVTHGGFGGAPKFPSPSQTLHFLARYATLKSEARASDVSSAIDMASKTLIKLYNGGIHDHIGQGFARYSVDDHWHVPHCEQKTPTYSRLYD